MSIFLKRRFHGKIHPLPVQKVSLLEIKLFSYPRQYIARLLQLLYLYNDRHSVQSMLLDIVPATAASLS